MKVLTKVQGVKINTSSAKSCLHHLIINKDQDFFDMEGGIGDFIRNMKGVAIETDTNPFGKFFSKEEAEKLIKEYNDKMKTKKAGGGIISLL